MVLAGIIQASFFQHVNMKIYINGTGNISPQRTVDDSLFMNEVERHEGPFLKCVDPDYNELIPKGQLPRRIGRSLKIGIASAAMALKEAEIENPDAIITGTGMGMLADTEKFLTTLIDNKEKFLNPSSFIQSTHNTIGAHIAVMLRCNKYNFTYVHGNISFENALLNALIRLRENQKENILVGGVDEITEQHYQIKALNHIYKKDPVDHLKLLEYKTEGAIPGEGYVFFSLSTGKKDSTYASIAGLETHYRVDEPVVRDEKIVRFLNAKGLSLDMIDLVLLGSNGDNESNRLHKNLQDGIFSSSNQAYYKHLCGEYPTSSAFATWLAASILKKQSIPEIIRINRISNQKDIRNVLICNLDRNVNHSLILLSQADS